MAPYVNVKNEPLQRIIIIVIGSNQIIYIFELWWNNYIHNSNLQALIYRENLTTGPELIILNSSIRAAMC